MEAIESIKYKGLSISVYQEEYPECPREWDNLGHMVCWHSRYSLGDEHDYRDKDDFLISLIENKFDRPEHYELLENWMDKSTEEKLEFLRAEGYIFLPLYLYEHSGITISTTPFSCRWDSGQVGWIYTGPKQIKNEFENNSEESIKKAEDILLSEVKTYDAYLTGDIYGFQITPIEDEDAVLDSCYGFYGSDFSNLYEDAKRSADYIRSRLDVEEKIKRLREKKIQYMELAEALHKVKYSFRIEEFLNPIEIEDYNSIDGQIKKLKEELKGGGDE